MNNLTKTALFILAIISLGSCKDKGTPLVTPQITGWGVTATDTTIAIGAKIDFAPKTTAIEGNSYSWEVAQTQVATTLDYTFTASEAGNYKIKFTVKNEIGSDNRELNVTVKRYVGGFYIVNEGWFGHEPGSVNYFDTKTGKLTPTVYAANNDGLTLGVTTCYGALWSGNYYYISKQDRRLVVADALSLKDKGALNLLEGDGRAFAGITETTGIITTSNGAYTLGLKPLALGNQLVETDGNQCGGVYATKEHVFVINQLKGLQIYSTNGYELVKTVAGVSVGFARSKDGSLWAADGGILFKIDTKALTVSEIELPSGVNINNSWGAWNTGSLSASTTENALFFTKSGMWGGGREVYRYEIGNIASLNQVFATSTATDDAFYGSGIAIDPASGDIVATFVKDGWGDSYRDNRLVVFDGKTGEEKSRTLFDGFYFPSMVLFN